MSSTKKSQPQKTTAPLADTPEQRKDDCARELTQAEEFADAARDFDADQDEDAFKGVLRKLAKPRT